MKPTLNFSEAEKITKSKKPLATLLTVGALAGVIALGSTLAASINLNSGAPVEFGQGVAQTTSCTGSDSLTITPYSAFDNSESTFSLTDIAVTHIPDSCLNKDFLIRVYSDSSVLSLDGFSSIARIQYRGESTHNVYSGTSGNSSLFGVITNVSASDGYGAFTLHLTAGSNGVLGAKPLASDVKRITVESKKLGLEVFAGLNIVTSGLQLGLNANNASSYASGNTWNDLSSNNYDFTLYDTSLNLVSETSDRNYFPFRTNYAKAIHESGDIPLNSSGTTLVLVTRIATGPSIDGGGWRTLIRGQYSDHQVLIGPSSGTFLGNYQNGSTGWIGTSLDVTSMPNYGTNNWETIYIRFQDTAPYMSVSAGSSPGTILGYSDDSRISLANGIYALGNYGGGTQQWGDIAAFYMYDRVLTNEELLQNFYALN